MKKIIYMIYLTFNKQTIKVYTKKELIMIFEINFTFFNFENTYTRYPRPEIATWMRITLKNKNKFSSALENRLRIFITKINNSNVAIKM